MDTRLGNMDTRLGNMDTRLGNMDTRLDNIDTRLDNIDIRLDNVDTRLDNMDTRLDSIDNRLKKVELTIENEISHNIMVIAEGHLDLNRKLDEAVHLASDIKAKQEIQDLYIRRHDNKLRMKDIS
jgi:division protein CdvB (Snf7/Vps24/ESCRT-III family)